jgi:hypothetical protein
MRQPILAKLVRHARKPSSRPHLAPGRRIRHVLEARWRHRALTDLTEIPIPADRRRKKHRGRAQVSDTD